MTTAWTRLAAIRIVHYESFAWPRNVGHCKACPTFRRTAYITWHPLRKISKPHSVRYRRPDKVTKGAHLRQMQIAQQDSLSPVSIMLAYMSHWEQKRRSPMQICLSECLFCSHRFIIHTMCVWSAHMRNKNSINNCYYKKKTQQQFKSLSIDAPRKRSCLGWSERRST